MGWALKSSQTKKTRFNDKQKQYLTQIFNLGQTTGHKANAADVAKSMMTTKDYQGERMFSKEKFRQLDRSKAFSPVQRQNDGYLSRLLTRQHDDDMESAEAEDYLQGLSDQVVQEVALRHPMIYDCQDVCELISNSKISKFAIPMLQRMCNHFNLDISDIKIKRKKPSKIDLTV